MNENPNGGLKTQFCCCEANAHHHRSHSGIGFGLVVILVGVVFLLDHLGVIAPYEPLDFWPLIFVAIGLVKLVTPGSGSRRIFGLVLIAIGVVVELGLLGKIDVRWGLIWPVLVILGGLHIAWHSIWSRKRQRQSQMHAEVSHSRHVLNEYVTFGGLKISNTSDAFQGGEVTVVCGGIELDLRSAEIAGSEAVLYAKATMGGIEIRIPEHWDAVVKGAGVLGGYEDKTRHPLKSAGQEPKRLIIHGQAVLGGVEVKN